MNNRAYVPFAAIAFIAGILGWGASTYANKQTAEAMPAQLAPQAFAQPQTQTAVLPDGQIVTVQPIQTAQPLNYIAQPVAPVTAPVAAPIIRTASAPVRTVAQPAARNTREDVSPAPIRKRGMSNKTKTVLAVGTGAGVGAAVGGIAKGGKGAAIGAIAGGGAAAVYSWIKHKKGQPVF